MKVTHVFINFDNGSTLGFPIKNPSEIFDKQKLVNLINDVINANEEKQKYFLCYDELVKASSFLNTKPINLVNLILFQIADVQKRLEANPDDPVLKQLSEIVSDNYNTETINKIFSR